jgi:hypothetical protein
MGTDKLGKLAATRGLDADTLGKQVGCNWTPSEFLLKQRP